MKIYSQKFKLKKIELIKLNVEKKFGKECLRKS